MRCSTGTEVVSVNLGKNTAFLRRQVLATDTFNTQIYMKYSVAGKKKLNNWLYKNYIFRTYGALPIFHRRLKKK